MSTQTTTLPEPPARPHTQPILREHWIVDRARKIDVSPSAHAGPQLAYMLIGALRECVRGRCIITVYRDLIAAHERAEEIVTERAAALAAEKAHYAPLVKPEPAPEPAPKPEPEPSEEQIAQARRLIFFSPFRDLDWVSKETGLSLEALRAMKEEETARRVAKTVLPLPGRAEPAPRPQPSAHSLEEAIQFCEMQDMPTKRGVVYFHEGDPCGWSETIQEPREFTPGVVAVYLFGGLRPVVAIGGSVEAGAARWVSLTEAAALAA